MNIISRELDYAIRILSFLSNAKSARVEDISKTLYIPKQFAHKIINKLIKKGYLISIRGRNGYIAFNTDLDTSQISALDIMKAFNSYKHVNLCTDDPTKCELNPYCSFTNHLQKLELYINKTLSEIKLKNIAFNI